MDIETGATLELLLERLQPGVLDVLAAPHGLRIPVGETLINDPAQPASAAANAVVLAVGVTGLPALEKLIAQVVPTAPAAIVVKPGADLDVAGAVALSITSGIALIAAPEALEWGRLFSLLTTASRQPPSADPGAVDVPLGDLFALANAVAARVGGATSIEDPQSRMLAYSNLGHTIDTARQDTILGRAVPSDWLDWLKSSGTFRELWRGDSVIHIAGGDDATLLPRMAVAVRAGGELLGSIWVIQDTDPFDADAERALLDAADLAALHLLRHRDGADVDRRRKSEALLGLINGAEPAEAASAALGLPTETPVAVLAFEVDGAVDNADAVVAAQRVAGMVAIYCESYRRQAACTGVGNRVYALCPSEPSEGRDGLRALADAVTERAAKAFRLTLRCGIGSTVPTINDVVLSRRDADDVLDVLRHHQPPGTSVADIDQVRAHVVLRRLGEFAAADPRLKAGKLRQILEQDALKGTDWAANLRAYFDCFGDVAAAAVRMNVHTNTFRYRLRRIVEIFDVDLDDSDERLVMELQLRFFDQPVITRVESAGIVKLERS